jgi:hypothetical protein
MTRKTLTAKWGVWLMRKRKVFLTHGNKLHVGYRHGRRAARSRVRHLAEDVVVGQRFEHAIPEPNFDLPVLNDE